jgi:H+/gluconate symporter-like permease
MPPGISSRRIADRRARRALIAALALAFSACATISPAPPQPPPAVISSKTSAEMAAMTAHLAERDRALTSIESAAIMSYAAPDRHAKARENITVSRPANLRVEAMSPFGVALVVATHGGRLEIFEPSKNKLITAVANARTLERFVQIPMAPADAVTLLLGIAPGTEQVASHAPVAITSETISADANASGNAPMIVGAWPAGGGAMRELGFSDGNLALVRLSNAAGQIEYEVRYADYHDIGGVMFPYSIEADFPQAHSHLTIRYERPIINGKIAPAIFDLRQSS